MKEHTPSKEPWASQFRLLEAEILLYQGDRGKAAVLLQSAVPGELRARKLVLEGWVDRQSGRRDQAFQKFGQAVELARERRDKDLEAEALVQQARVRQDASRWDEAEQILTQVEATGSDYWISTVWINRGLKLLQTAQYDPAMKMLEKAEALTRAAGSEAAHSAVILNLAICRERLGDYEQAETMLRQSLALHEKLKAQLLIMRTAGSLGRLEQDLGRLDQAIANYRRATEIAQRISDESFAHWSGWMASALIEAKNIAEAEQWNRNALQPKQNINAGLIAGARGRWDDAARLLELALGESEDAEDRWTCLAYLATAQRNRGRRDLMHRAYRQAIGAIAQKRAQLSKPDYQLSFLSRLIRNYQDYVAVLLEEKQIDQALSVEESSRAQLIERRTGRREASGNTISRNVLHQLTAGSRASLLGFWLSPQGSHVWVANGGKVDLVDLNVSPQRVAELVADHNRTIVEKRRDVRNQPASAAAELWRVLLKPAAHLVRGERLVVVPDGAMHELNLETLIDEQGNYLIDSKIVVSAPSFAVLSSASEASARANDALIVGDPLQVDPDFPRLTYAGQELGALRRIFDNRCRVLAGAQATPDAFLEAHAGEFGYIHFAAHAKANRESPLDSSVLLSNGKNGYKLYARDVMNLQLRARLVTISACRGAGVRNYSGEGLVGFSWAFLRAGARHVIAGLWDVADASTAMLMEQLYSYLSKGHPPAAALRAAKRRLLAGGGNLNRPYYWAPFQIYTREKI
ncbi:MAG: CHAT domain-containing protein [Bryobacterales bacterium]|nr:CHAT domain-containing protein [Bryobacterales bacterium]